MLSSEALNSLTSLPSASSPCCALTIYLVLLLADFDRYPFFIVGPPIEVEKVSLLSMLTVLLRVEAGIADFFYYLRELADAADVILPRAIDVCFPDEVTAVSCVVMSVLPRYLLCVYLLSALPLLEFF